MRFLRWAISAMVTKPEIMIYSFILSVKAGLDLGCSRETETVVNYTYGVKDV